VSSGKRAVSDPGQLNCLTGKKKVIIPAYTCFFGSVRDPPAGLEIVLCDIEPEHSTSIIPPEGFDRRRHIVRYPDPPVRDSGRYLESREICDTRKFSSWRMPPRRWEPYTKGENWEHRRRRVFSLGRGKNITCGSGGIIVTSSEEIAGSIESNTGT